MDKIKALILVTLLSTGILGACAPTVDPAGTNDRFKLEGRALVLDMTAPVLYGYGSVPAPVVSRYCEGEVTPEPRRCPLEDGWSDLDLPQGRYGRRVVVGQVLKPPGAGGFLDVALEGAGATFRAELTRPAEQRVQP